MTIDKDRKRSIRERMAKTGESYVVARMREIGMPPAGPTTPDVDASIDLTPDEREDLAALWLEINAKRTLVPRELTFEPFVFGIVVSSMAREWPGKKECIADLEARMLALAQRVAAGGDAAVRDWIISLDQPATKDPSPPPTETDKALLTAWLDLRKDLAGNGVEIAPGAPLLAHELAEFGDPRTWREMRPVLKRIRRLVTDQRTQSTSDRPPPDDRPEGLPTG
jgi:hypothetical protein